MRTAALHEPILSLSSRSSFSRARPRHPHRHRPRSDRRPSSPMAKSNGQTPWTPFTSFRVSGILMPLKGWVTTSGGPPFWVLCHTAFGSSISLDAVLFLLDAVPTNLSRRGASVPSQSSSSLSCRSNLGDPRAPFPFHASLCNTLCDGTCLPASLLRESPDQFSVYF